MRRRQFLKTAAASLAATAVSFSKTRPNEKPNIVFIMADDLGYECLSCNGGLSYKTPVLDGLAETGVRFTHTFAQPLCTPTRVQLMTGKYNFRNYTQFGSLKPGEFTIGHLLQHAGYKTCVVGKWQLAGRVRGMNYQAPGTMPAEAGFDEYCLWQIKHKGSRYWTPSININGVLHKDMQNKYGPDVFCDYALDFIERQANAPFFLYFPMVLTHAPFLPTPDSAGLNDSEKRTAKSDTKFFGDNVRYMDKIVGRLVAKLDELELRQKTLLIFLGDNGTHGSVVTQTSNGAIRGDKGRPTMAGMHVPMIANWPGHTPENAVCDDLVDLTDFMPTLAKVGGTQLPANHPRDGVSFLPQIKGRKGKPRDWIFSYYEPNWGKWKPARFVMNKRYKLYDDGRFYDVANDPHEQSAIKEKNKEMERIAAGFERVLESMK